MLKELGLIIQMGHNDTPCLNLAPTLTTTVLDHNGIHASAVLDVEVGVEHVAGVGDQADHCADLDVLFEGDLQVVDGGFPNSM